MADRRDEEQVGIAHRLGRRVQRPRLPRYAGGGRMHAAFIGRERGPPRKACSVTVLQTWAAPNNRLGARGRRPRCGWRLGLRHGETPGGWVRARW